MVEERREELGTRDGGKMSMYMKRGVYDSRETRLGRCDGHVFTD